MQFEPLMLKEFADEVHAQIMTNWIGYGPRVEEFETELCSYMNAKHAIALSSGTSALITALSSIGIDYRSKVVLPDYSFIAATNAVRFLGATPVFIDINEETLCLDFEHFKNYCDNNVVDAVIFINHNGYVGPDLVKVIDLCKERDIFTIEDAACALGQWYNGKHAGTRADMGCFSFSVPKVITTGQGGLLITNNDYLAQRSREIIDQGSTTWRRDGYHKNVGLNFKFNEISARLGTVQWKKIENIFKIRQENYERYTKHGLKLHYYPADKPNGPWMNILTKVNAESVMNKLAMQGIQSKMYYRPTHCSVGLNKCTKYPIADKIFKETLYLPSSFNLNNDDIDLICDIVKRK